MILDLHPRIGDGTGEGEAFLPLREFSESGLEVSNVTEDEILRERFRSALKILEFTDIAAVTAKRKVELIFDIDAKSGEDVTLVPSRFEVDGHVYHAMITPEQRDFITLKSQQHTLAELLDLVLTVLFENHLYRAAQMAEAILVAGLKNQEMPVLIDGALAKAIAGVHLHDVEAPMSLVGACQFATTCKEPFGKALCLSQGGTFVGSCAEHGTEPDEDEMS